MFGGLIFLYRQNKKLQISVKIHEASAETLKSVASYNESIKNTFLSEIKNKETEIKKLTEFLEESARKWSDHSNILQKEIQNLLENQAKNIKAARLDASSTQRAIVRGQISENISPLLPNWRWEIGDCRFLGGSPCDFIVYQGLSKDSVENIVFVDCKTGFSQLSTRQKQIKSAIESGKVSFEVFNPDK